ncbi:microtubule-associated Nat9 [Carabus blaptoides fortunei]
MRKNYYTVITGTNVILVSYKKEHVAQYNQWMKSTELQKLTASEPLTLYEEYKMQQTWLNDKTKCTFIILDKEIYWDTRDEIESMIGDTNLFFTDPENMFSAEAEIMIAEESFRRHEYEYVSDDYSEEDDDYFDWDVNSAGHKHNPAI